MTKRICIGLQRADANRILHGYETGVIERSPDGGFAERHAPLPVGSQFTLTTHDRLPVLEAPPETDTTAWQRRTAAWPSCAPRSRAFYYDGVIDKPTVEDVHHADEHLRDHDGHPVELGDEFQGVSETGIPRVH